MGRISGLSLSPPPSARELPVIRVSTFVESRCAAVQRFYRAATNKSRTAQRVITLPRPNADYVLVLLALLPGYLSVNWYLMTNDDLIRTDVQWGEKLDHLTDFFGEGQWVFLSVAVEFQLRLTRLVRRTDFDHGAHRLTDVALFNLRRAAIGRGCGLTGRRCAALHQVSPGGVDRKSTRLNSSHSQISYAVFCLKK